MHPPGVSPPSGLALIAGLGDGGVHAIKPQTGEKVWSLPLAKRAVNTGVAVVGNDVFVSHGDFYAASVIDRLGLRAAGGLIRAGCALYTTESEVDRLIEGVAGLSAASAP